MFSSSKSAFPVNEGIIEGLVGNGVQIELLEDQSECFLSALNLGGDLLEALLLEVLLKFPKSLLYKKDFNVLAIIITIFFQNRYLPSWRLK